MRLSDIMGQMDLSVYPQVALVIFLGVFASVGLRVARLTRGDAHQHACIPLEGPAHTTTDGR